LKLKHDNGFKGQATRQAVADKVRKSYEQQVFREKSTNKGQ